jgi:soluble lytic murein transglycosylase-like protein
VRKWLTAAAVVLGATTLASAAELAVLRNGFTIRHERHEVVGDSTRLYTGESLDSYIELPSEQIASYEHDDTPTPEADPSEAVKLDMNGMLKDAGAKHGLDPDFLASVIHAESGYNVKAVSPKGARGLMQLMPKTAEQLGVKDSFDPAANVEGGTKYLRALLDQYNGDVPKALAAYNAGALRVAQYNGVPPYAETHAYVRRIIAEYNRKKAAAKKTTTQAVAKKPISSASSQ